MLNSIIILLRELLFLGQPLRVFQAKKYKFIHPSRVEEKDTETAVDAKVVKH